MRYIFTHFYGFLLRLGDTILQRLLLNDNKRASRVSIFLNRRTIRFSRRLSFTCELSDLGSARRCLWEKGTTAPHRRQPQLMESTNRDAVVSLLSGPRLCDTPRCFRLYIMFWLCWLVSFNTHHAFRLRRDFWWFWCGVRSISLWRMSRMNKYALMVA